MKNLINKIKLTGGKEILVIGDVMLDEYVFGSVTRISPEAPVPILKEERKEWSLGGAANVALNCKHVGCEVNLIGIIGNSNDYAENKLLSMLKENRISINGLVKSDQRNTTLKKRMLAEGQQLLRVDSENNADLSEKEFLEIEKKIKEFIKPGIVILISDYVKGVVTEKFLSKILILAKKYNCLVLADPKKTDFNKYKGVNYLKPNLKEFNQILEFYNLSKDDSIIKNGKMICELLSLDGLIITLGSEGIQFISKKEDIFIPARKQEVFDLTGAGDTVFAFLGLGLSLKLPMKQCLKLANHAASVAVSHLKTYAVSLDELIDKNIDLSEKIFYDWASLKIELDWLRLEGKRVVVTNGCFDLLHSGHIYSLEEAKKQGDILVVALNTDDSIKRLKGNDRPIKTLDERAKVLSAIGIVDFIISFGQDTPKELIKYLKPDILVKGGDYKKEDVVGYHFMKKYGGKVHIVPYQKGLGTTSLIEIARRGRINC